MRGDGKSVYRGYKIRGKSRSEHYRAVQNGCQRSLSATGSRKRGDRRIRAGYFDTPENQLLPSNFSCRIPPLQSRPRRLAWPRTSPFHGGNTGSNPVGDAKSNHTLTDCIPVITFGSVT